MNRRELLKTIGAIGGLLAIPSIAIANRSKCRQVSYVPIIDAEGNHAAIRIGHQHAKLMAEKLVKVQPLTFPDHPVIPNYMKSDQVLGHDEVVT